MQVSKIDIFWITKILFREQSLLSILSNFVFIWNSTHIKNYFLVLPDYFENYCEFIIFVPEELTTYNLLPEILFQKVMAETEINNKKTHTSLENQYIHDFAQKLILFLLIYIIHNIMILI